MARLQGDAARRLADAVASWLSYQKLCGREHLFSEALLSQPVGEYLAGVHSGVVTLEYPHPSLPNPKRGRPRQLDVVTLSRDTQRPETAIELKWAGKTLPTRQRLFDDLFRLECVRSPERQGMTRFFLLAGSVAGVEAVLGWEVNAGGRQPFTSLLLPSELEDETTVDVHRAPEHLRQYVISFQDQYQVQPARRFLTKLVVDKSAHGFRTLLWRVSSSRGRRSFDPAVKWADVEVSVVDPEEAAR